jgi:hypothetical protein
MFNEILLLFFKNGPQGNNTFFKKISIFSAEDRDHNIPLGRGTVVIISANGR